MVFYKLLIGIDRILNALKLNYNFPYVLLTHTKVGFCTLLPLIVYIVVTIEDVTINQYISLNQIFTAIIHLL